MNFTLIVLGGGWIGIGLGIVSLLFAEAASKHKHQDRRYSGRTPGRANHIDVS